MNDCGLIHLEKFVNQVIEFSKSRSNDEEVTYLVLNTLKENLMDERFILDCLCIAIDQMPPNLDTWLNRPIVNNDVSNFSIRLLYWPAKSSNFPHKHTNWTVTGVVFGELLFRIYQETLNRDKLVVDKEFLGAKGEAGRILPPCIHSVHNFSDEPSISLHIFSGPLNTLNSNSHFERGNTEWYNMEDKVEAVNPNYIFLVLISYLSKLNNKRAIDLIGRIFEVGDISIKLSSAKAIGLHDSALASFYLNRLAPLCSEIDRGRIKDLAERLLNENNAKM